MARFFLDDPISRGLQSFDPPKVAGELTETIWPRPTPMDKIAVPLHLREHRTQLLEIAQRIEVESSHLMRWIRQFAADDIPYILPLLTNFRFVSSQEQLVMIQDLGNRLRRSHLEDGCIVSLGPVGKSGPVMVHAFSKHQSIPKSHVVPFEKIENIETFNSKHVVVLDDFLGTGDTAKKHLPRVQQHAAGKQVIACFLVATRTGFDELANSLPSISIEVIEMIELDDKAFSAKVFPSRLDGQRAREICFRLGHQLEPKMPLGYGNGELLFGWSAPGNCPNNTLPIFWSTNNWFPLFRTPQPPPQVKGGSSEIIHKALTTQPSTVMVPELLEAKAVNSLSVAIHGIPSQLEPAASRIELRVLFALSFAGRPMNSSHLVVDYLPTHSINDVSGACERLCGNDALIERDGAFWFSETQTLSQVRANAVGLIGQELLTGVFDVLAGLKLPSRLDTRKDDSKGIGILEQILSVMAREWGPRETQERKLLDLLAQRETDFSITAANLLTLLILVRGDLCGMTLPACTLLTPDLSGVALRNLDIRQCRLVRPRFTTSLRNISAVAFIPGSDEFFLGDSNGNVALIRWRDADIAWRMPLHTQWVRDIVLASLPFRAFSCSEDGRVCSFNLSGDANTLVEVGKPCWGLSLSEDEQLLAVACDDGQVQFIQTIGQPSRIMQHAGRAPVRAIAWLPARKSFIVGDDQGTLSLLNGVEAPIQMLTLPSGIRSLAILKSGHILVGGQNGNIWRLSASGQIMSTIEFHLAEVRSIVPLSMSEFVSFSRDGRIAFWDFGSDVAPKVISGFEGGVRLARLDGHNLGVCSQNRAFVIDSGSAEVLSEVTGVLDEAWGVAVSGEEVLVGIETGELLVFKGRNELRDPLRIEAHSRRIRSVTVSPDGARLATGSSDRTVRIWTKTADRWALDQQLPKHLTWLRALVFFGGNRWLAIGSGDGRIRVWDCAKRGWAREMLAHEGDIQGIAALPSANRLISIGKDRNLVVHSFDSGKTELQLPLPCTPWAIISIQDRVSYIGLDNGQIAFLDEFDNLRLLEGSREGSAVTGLAYCFRRNILAAASRDGFLACYEMNGHEIRRSSEVHAHNGGTNAVALSEANSYLVTSGADGSIAMWTLDQLKQLDRYQASLPYNGMLFNSGGLPRPLIDELECLGAIRDVSR